MPARIFSLSAMVRSIRHLLLTNRHDQSDDAFLQHHQHPNDNASEDGHERSTFELRDLLLPPGRDNHSSHFTSPLRRLFRGPLPLCLKRMAMLLVCLLLMALGLLHLLQALIGQAELPWDRGDFSPNGGVPNFDELSIRELTALAHNALPVPCHSHNDYWRPNPLFTAIAVGCTSVEADVWLLDDDLYVGHSMKSIQKNKTVRQMYLEPLLEMLDQNTADSAQKSIPTKQASIFNMNPNQTLVLLVDFKSNGPEVLTRLHDQLQPLRDKGYLSYYNGEKRINGAVTIVATGNAIFESILSNNTHRDIFFDAPLQSIWRPPGSPIADTDERTFVMDYGSAMADGLRPASPSPAIFDDQPNADFDETNSYYTSVSFRSAVGYVWRGHLSPRQMRVIRGHINGARRRGLKMRYWDTPYWPVALRNHVWHVLFKEGADVLSVDDVKGCAMANWQTKGHGSWW